MNPSISSLAGGISIEHIQQGWTVHIARLHDPGKSYGADWHASMIMLLKDDECMMIGGISIDEKISKQHSGIIVEYLRSKGIKKIHYRKVKNGELHSHELSI
jgi:hypothetical protein